MRIEIESYPPSAVDRATLSSVLSCLKEFLYVERMDCTWWQLFIYPRIWKRINLKCITENGDLMWLRSKNIFSREIF